MKNSNTQKRKLIKSELKEINGGIAPRCLRGFCTLPDSGEMVPGLIGKDGFCC